MNEESSRLIHHHFIQTNSTVVFLGTNVIVLAKIEVITIALHSSPAVCLVLFEEIWIGW